MKKISGALVVVDPQNDFCDRRGALYVGGADDDMKRLAAHIENRADEYSDIFISLDSHDAVAVFHPKFWIDASGANPEPYTAISRTDYDVGKWKGAIPEYDFYIRKMFDAAARKNVASVTIWPEHCLVSSWGWGIAAPLAAALETWRAKSRRPVRYIFKGENPYTEQFSIFEGLDDSWPGTAFNEDLCLRLSDFGAVTFAGEALTHCVEASVNSYVSRRAGAGTQRLYLLSDCSSAIPGFDAGACRDRLESRGVLSIGSAA
jgi:nicotinamidase-related amidase